MSEVVGYHLYKNNARVATIAALALTFRGLRCGTHYTLALEAVDGAGNSSYRPEAVASVATSACVTAVKHPTAAPRHGGAKPSSAPPPGSAHLWVDTNGGSCRRSAAPRAYVDGQACSSLQSAYKAARTGDTVGIRTGVYPGQTLSAGTKGVTFRAAGPGRPRFGHFVSAATNITVRGILIQDRSEQNGACNTAPYGVLTPAAGPRPMTTSSSTG